MTTAEYQNKRDSILFDFGQTGDVTGAREALDALFLEVVGPLELESYTTEQTRGGGAEELIDRLRHKGVRNNLRAELRSVIGGGG